MALKFQYLGQNDGTTVPDVALTGDPAVDQPALTAAGYIGGRIMALKTSAVAGRGAVIVPCDAATMVPYGTLINGGGEYATSIGPSGSRLAPVVRAMWKGTVDSQAYVASPSAPYAVGGPLYCGVSGNAGLYTADKPTGSEITALGYAAPVGTCTHIPTALEPYLGVASLL